MISANDWEFENKSIVDEILECYEHNYENRKKKSFPEEFHPRRNICYKPFHPNIEMYFLLRTHGVPILTAYFLSESSNLNKLHRTLQNYDEGERAIFILRKISTYNK